MTYIYKDKEYSIQTGTRGGKFFIDDKGKKHYLKNENAKPRKKKEKPVVCKPLEKKRYTVWIDVYDKNGEQVDDFKEWTVAYSEEEALSEIKHDHPNRSDRTYEMQVFKVEPYNED